MHINSNLIYDLRISLKQSAVLLLLFIKLSLFGQESSHTSLNNVVESYDIEWVCSIPQEKKEDDQSWLNRIGEFIFGKKQVISLSKPISVFAKNLDSIYVLDQGVGALVFLQMNVGEIPYQVTEKYSSIVGICSGPDNELFFTESRFNSIFKFLPHKNELYEFKCSNKLNQPTGIAFSNDEKEIWVVETGAHRITVFDLYGNEIRQIGKRGKGAGEFNYPTFIWIDASGLVYIVDSMNFRIQILNSDGEMISSFGEAGDATGFFSRPKGIATDSHGNIYVVDALFHAVQVFDQRGTLLYHFGHQGREDGQFWMPTGIYVDHHDLIYIADSYNSRIQVFQLITKGHDEHKNY
ncbi:MAG: 6-bladed beta-propeller [Bacteroidetes bacterium]|nr:6-bladed beta-propeller [Bacteroidota bacterium]